MEKAEYYFNKFGPAKAVVLARFIPIVRTFLNPVAGVLEHAGPAVLRSTTSIGGVLWTDGVLLLGYLLADQITTPSADQIDKYLLPVIVLIVLISVLPIFFEFLRDRKARRRGEAVAVVAAASAVGAVEAVRDAARRHHPSRPAPAAVPANRSQQQHGHQQQQYGDPQQYGQQQSYGGRQPDQPHGHDQQFPPQTYGQSRRRTVDGPGARSGSLTGGRRTAGPRGEDRPFAYTYATAGTVVDQQTDR